MEEKKKVLLAMPIGFGLHTMMVKNLELNNFDITSICIPEFEYQNTKDKLVNFLRKTFLGDKEYKRTVLYYDYKSRLLNEKLSSFSKDYFDYCLFIRPDVYPIDIINRANEVSKKSIGYQWDGLNRFPAVFDRISLFDSFYAFDKDDFKNYKETYPNLKITTNFYSSFDSNLNVEHSDVYYLGTYYKNRMEDILNVYKELEPLKLKLNLLIFRHKKNRSSKYELPGINFFKGVIRYEENLSYIKNTKAILDFKTEEHSGLSFRFFEALKYKVKIITNNVDVANYSFYNKNNVFIIGLDSYKELPSFIEGAYKELDQENYQKYSFDTWILNLLND
jgi:hypothetical protein